MNRRRFFVTTAAVVAAPKLFVEAAKEPVVFQDRLYTFKEYSVSTQVKFSTYDDYNEIAAWLGKAARKHQEQLAADLLADAWSD